MIKYMLDTNSCIYTIKNKPQKVREAFYQHYGQLCISSVTLMELIYRSERSANPKKNLDIIEGFAARLEVMTYGFDAAVHTGQIRTPGSDAKVCQAIRPASLGTVGSGNHFVELQIVDTILDRYAAYEVGLRKGVTPARAGELALIPGSMGDYSYLGRG
ncbi:MULTISPECIES: RtcB family protein [Xenorhabdus]|uniref:3'-phosphate/5'-hydroxy nucleic acid ligase n=1 Tax=Xenorhabdus ehlersii TaxID=290111 RepID=A0A2D0IPP3_9GAMM|nr:MULTISPECIES: RtcB family protein [Xenorhabdus]MBC8949322.1 plasmid maintenance protein [Xenorhabdus sp. TS4]PHM23790.1 plasmid maintenance protein [Xenorhabdus ehlersii]RKE89245.1 tRNA-splicing ligase RtcB [Xenorhabdus ehlersii]